MGAPLRADRLQALALGSWSRFLGLAQGCQLPGLVWGLMFGARDLKAAVCILINLHLLTGSGGAVVCACGPRMLD